MDLALHDRVSERLGTPVTHMDVTDVSEKLGDGALWARTVHTFGSREEKGRICYAWRESNPDTGKDRIYTVLQTEQIKTPKDAVRASFVADYDAKRGPMES